MTKRRNNTPASAAPSHLSDRSRALWAELAPRKARSLGRQVLLQIGLEQLDAADAARAVLNEHGTTFTTESTGAVHERPECRIEREARRTFLRIWRDLNLDWDQAVDGRYQSGDL